MRDAPTKERIKGLGRLVPTPPTGVEYEVSYGIAAGAIRSQGPGWTPTYWVRCSLRSADARRIPEGCYFLYSHEGPVHQVKSIDGEWHYLAPSWRKYVPIPPPR